MKFNCFKRAAAVVTAAVMMMGVLAGVPGECFPEFGIVASAETTEIINVSTPEGLNAIRNNLSGNYRLTQDIDMSSWTNWEPIGEDSPFKGTLDGDGYVIKNLTINANQVLNCGLFGVVNGGKIEKLGLENVNITSSYTSDDTAWPNTAGITGGLENSGIIEQCYVTGKITANNSNKSGCRVAGLVGYTGPGASVSDCYVNAELSGTAKGGNTMVAGAVAWLNSGSSVNNSYAAGTISGKNSGYCYAGGLAASGDNGSINKSMALQQSINATGSNVISNVICEFATCNDCSYLNGIAGNASTERWYNNDFHFVYGEYEVIASQEDAYLQKSYANWDFNFIWKERENDYPSLRCYIKNVIEEKASGQCGDNAYWSLTSDGILTISGSGSLYGYSSYVNFGGDDYTTAPWWKYRKNISKIVVKSGITKITEYAFMNMHYVNEIEFEDGIKTIDSFNFCCNDGLTKIIIPKSVTGIGNLCCWKGGTNSELTIYGYSGSVAETYAKNNNLKFVDLALEEKGYIKLSPLNDDGITVGDGESILAYVYDKDDNRLSDVNLVWTSSDEKIVTITDSNNLGAVVEGKSAGEATITCEDTVSGFIGTITVKVTPFVKYRGMNTTKDKTLYFDYSDDYFSNFATVFNQKLAQASLALELASWTSYDTDYWTSYGDHNRDRNLREAFKNLGFDIENKYEQYKYEYSLSNYDDTVAFGVCSKEITNADGTKSNLVAIALRGGGYGAEWASNFNVGNSNVYANGFYNASKNVYNYITDYLSRYNFDNNTKIWITGYSRAAATANLVAAQLCQVYDNKNIYAYTFATPQGYVFRDPYSNDKNDGRYDNIHNIISPADLVPTVAFSDWGFGRYGKSYYINFNNNSEMQAIYAEQMSQKPKKDENLIYKYNSKLPDVVREFDDLLTFFVPNVQFYAENVQPSLVDFIANANSQNDWMTGGIIDGIIPVLREMTTAVSKQNSSTITFEVVGATGIVFSWYTVNKVSGGLLNKYVEYKMDELNLILNQHYPEAYIAWVFSSDKADIYSECRYKTAIIKCPVDVYVYDGNGTLVTSIIDNEIIKEDVNAAVFGDQKRVYLHDDTYTIKLVGNDTGTMDYSIEEHDSDGYITRRVSYYDLPLEDGTTYTGVVNDEVDTPSNNYDLSSDEGNYSSDFDRKDSTDEEHNIIINGGLASTPSAYPGEQVTITALVSSDDSTFSKWITTSSVTFNDAQTPVATFIMPNEDVEITAVNCNTSSRLSNILVDSTAIADFAYDITAYTVTLPYGTTAIPTVTATPANENADVDITQAASLTGTEAERTAIITVTAEDGVTKTVYTVVFSIESHTHNLATEYSSDATGHWYECSNCADKVSFEPHTEDSGTVTKEPTETTEGERTFKCTKCGYVIRTDSIAVLGHTHTPSAEYSSDAAGHWHACSGCTEKVDFESHTEDSGTVTTEPTETTEGERSFKCTKCGYVIRTEAIPIPVPSDPITAFVERLYLNILNRPSDPSKVTHIDNLNNGESASKVAFDFVFSSEFAELPISNEERVRRMYLTFLNREADPAGLADWTAVLDNGCSIGHIFYGFTQSNEFTEICEAYGINRGTWECTENRDRSSKLTAFVSRLYTKAMGRNYDVNGLNDHTGTYLENRDLYQLAYNFIFSQEFIEKNLSDEDFVDVMYRTFFDREADPAGKADWLGRMKSGCSREDVLAGFVGSQECGELVARFGI